MTAALAFLPDQVVLPGGDPIGFLVASAAPATGARPVSARPAACSGRDERVELPAVTPRV